jgi:hypothetical protein
MSVIVYIPSNFNDSNWIRYTFFLRMLRLLRMGRVLQFPSMLRFLYVFVSVEHMRVFYETFISMLPAASRLFKVRTVRRPVQCAMCAFACNLHCQCRGK